MKLETAKKIVAVDQRIKETEIVIKYFNDETGYPRISLSYDRTSTLIALENTIEFKKGEFDLEIHELIIRRLKERVESLKEQLKELENE